jgi:hypothetical protein
MGNEFQDSSEWQEFWDEQAQAKYWYNQNTGEASWTKPDDDSKSMTTGSVANSAAASARENGDWISYLDGDTGQEYWYNNKTGETSWG